MEQVLKAYPDTAQQAAFLLGGIGTGNISLGSRGEMRDFEIFNNPAKGNTINNTFFAIRVKKENELSVTRVLESRHRPPYAWHHGASSSTQGGLPRFESASLRGEYPFATVDFKDSSLPVSVNLEAYTPFIPLNADDSGIPAIVFRYRVKNVTCRRVEVSVAGSLSNVTGFAGFDPFGNMKTDGVPENKKRTENGLCGVYFTNKRLQPHQLNYGSLALLTRDKNVSVKQNWHTTGHWDGITDFWDDFSADGRVEDTPSYRNRTGTHTAVGSLAIHHSLEPGEERDFEFVLSWYFPTRKFGWDTVQCEWDGRITKNYYATLFGDAWDAGSYLLRNIDRLECATRDFHRAFFSASLPEYVLDAVSSNITQLRSNTCFRIEDGTFLGWEGNNLSEGSCYGTCTHVWNYAQTVAFLFPELERSARRVELLIETDDDGSMMYRTTRVFDMPKFWNMPAADGQLGVLMRLYREWKLSGDAGFVKEVWDKAVLAMEFAFTNWDTDGDLLLDSEQHNTYDIEFFGVNPLTGTLFLGALRAMSELANIVGDSARAERYLRAFETSRTNMVDRMWNGEYYVQLVDDVDELCYQFGKGCLSDQLFGQLTSHVYGLGYLLPEDQVKKALLSIFKYNFKDDFYDRAHAQRAFALNDEQGLLLCSWPLGGRPRLPFVYSDEVWAGVEYHVAAHLIYEDYVDEGLKLVKAVRDRYDGVKRNPWNEIECGNHYARSMASWAVLTALSGFSFDMAKKVVSFDPKINTENFECFFCSGLSWGIYRQTKNPDGTFTRELETLYGDPNVTLQNK